jgi:tight adherence protein B
MDGSSYGALLMLLGGIIAVTLVLADRAQARAVALRVDLVAGAEPGQLAVQPIRRTRILNGAVRLFAVRLRGGWEVATKPLTLLAVGTAAAVGLWLLASMALRLPGYVAAIGAAIGFLLAPRILLIVEQRHTASRFAELLPDTIDMIVRIVRAGLPISAAIRAVAQEATPPINGVFAQVANQAEIGIPLDEALAKTGAAIGNPDFRFLAVAIALQQSTGGNLATTLDTLAQIIRKRRAVRLKAYSATAEVRLSAIILAAIPFFVTGILLLVAPSYLDPLFSDPRGHLILGAALLGLVLAGLMMRGMIRHAVSA